MSALPPEVPVTQARFLRAAPMRIESVKAHAMQVSTILRAIGEQVRALFLAQRSLPGQFTHAASAVEDDYRRFSNQPC
jgi:hypothetical protein